MISRFRRLGAPLVTGAGIGLVAGLPHGAAMLAFAGFWMSFVWLLVLSGPVALWFSVRRQHAGPETLAFALGVSGVMAACACYDAYRGVGLSPDEVWFPTTLAFLLGLTLAPMVTAIRRYWHGRTAT